MLKNRFQYSSQFDDNNDANPMDGVSNMSDCMLVLAVGIMLAVVINWKVDIKAAYSVKNNEQVNEEDMLEIDEDNTQNSSSVSYDDLQSKYKKSGTVYTDVYSGKTYVVIED